MADKKDSNKGKRAQDDDLWDLAMADVKPLKGKKAPKAAGPKGRKAVGAREIVPPQRGETEAARKGQGLDRKTDDRLKKGKMEIDARIDLHGYRLVEAEEVLTRTLQKCYREGKRCALVITGKGSRAKPENDWWEGKPGAIRASVPEWLGKKALVDIVLRFYPAKPQDGGAGALYVLLRRKR